MDPRAAYIAKRLKDGFGIAKATDVEKFFLQENIKAAVDDVINGAEGSATTITFTYFNDKLALYEPVFTPLASHALVLTQTCPGDVS